MLLGSFAAPRNAGLSRITGRIWLRGGLSIVNFWTPIHAIVLAFLLPGILLVLLDLDTLDAAHTHGLVKHALAKRLSHGLIPVNQRDVCDALRAICHRVAVTPASLLAFLE